jgi:hypothetical protein
MTPNEPVDPGTGVRYHPGSMELNQRILRCAGNFRAVPCAVLAVVALLLVVVPFLDLGWNEPTLEQGALCQFHANPGAAVGPAPLVVWHSADPLSPSDPVVHFALLSPSIFIPPRA